MTDVKRSYAGETGAARTQRRRTELLDAAFELVADDGWNALRIDAVCRAAGLNKRYFYESFAGLDELTGALLQRLADEAIAATLAEVDVDAPDDDAYLRRPITSFVEHLTDDPRRARVLFGAADDGAAAHREKAIHEIIAVVDAQGRQRHGIEDPVVVGVVASMLVGGTSQAVLDFLDGRLGDSREQFADELVALWVMVSDAMARR